MAFKDFMAQVRTRGLAMRSHYLVELTPPTFLMTSNTETLPIIPLFCEQAMFPEFALATTTVKDAGLNREVVHDKMFGRLTLTFACDQQMVIKEFFDKWAMAPMVTHGGVFRYPAEYIVPEMTIYQLDAKKQEVYAVSMQNIYPQIVNDIFLNASDKSYSNFQVVFVYESWYSFNYKVDTSPPPPAPQTAPLDYNEIARMNEVLKPKRIIDVARILDYTGGLSKEGVKSAIITRGTMALQNVITKGNNGFNLGNLL